MESFSYKLGLINQVLEILKDDIRKENVSQEDKDLIDIAIKCLETSYSVPEQKDEIRKTEVTDEELYKAENLKILGNALLKEGHYEEAIAEYTSAIILNASNSTYYCNRAMAYLQINKFENAVEDSKTALKLNPNCSKAYDLCGSAYMNVGNWMEAFRVFEKALKHNPDNKVCEKKLQIARQHFYESIEFAAPTHHKPIAFTQFVNSDRYKNKMQEIMNSEVRIPEKFYRLSAQSSTDTVCCNSDQTPEASTTSSVSSIDLLEN